MRSFAHHVEYEESGYNDKLKKLIQSKSFIQSLEKESNKWQEGKNLQSINLNYLPEYININRLKFKDWID